MSGPIHINPDNYLETEAGRVFSPERNKLAWERSYVDLAQALQDHVHVRRLFVVIGVQGAGKSTWVEANRSLLEGSVVFDASLPARSHRVKVLALAAAAQVPAIAVWINVPLDLALSRNESRPADQRVPEAAVRSVFSTIEPPSLDEGFSEVIEVSFREVPG